MSTLKEKDKHIKGSFSFQQGDDRLSSLPDSLLITIISLLPINSAAATSVLSRRWLNLWTHTTHLSVTSSFVDFQSFVTTLNHILSQLQSLKLDTFHVQPSLPSLVLSAKATPLFYYELPVHQICLRNPTKFSLNYGFYTEPKNIFMIPFCLFQTRSLVELVLFADFELKFLQQTDLRTSIYFPNLKKLCLGLYDSNCDLVARNKWSLVTACPLLEYLNLVIWWFVDDVLIIDISNAYLKRLYIDVCARGWEDTCKFVIDAPMLELCTIEGDLMYYEFVSRPTNLRQVIVSFVETRTEFEDHKDYVNKTLGLIQGISCVRSLVLKGYATNMLNCIISHSNVLPIFHNLIHLSFSYNIDAWEINELPGCFLLGKKIYRLDVQDLVCQDVEIDFIQHFLSNATALKRLHLSCYPDDVRETREAQLQREYEFCKKTFMLPKSSVNCHIVFTGLVISTSSKEFRDGVLTYQIRDN